MLCHIHPGYSVHCACGSAMKLWNSITREQSFKIYLRATRPASHLCLEGADFPCLSCCQDIHQFYAIVENGQVAFPSSLPRTHEPTIMHLPPAHLLGGWPGPPCLPPASPPLRVPFWCTRRILSWSMCGGREHWRPTSPPSSCQWALNLTKSELVCLKYISWYVFFKLSLLSGIDQEHIQVLCFIRSPNYVTEFILGNVM